MPADHSRERSHSGKLLAFYGSILRSMCPFLKEFVKQRRFPPSFLRTGSARRGCRFFPISWPCLIVDRCRCRSLLDSSRLSSLREVAIVLC